MKALLFLDRKSSRRGGALLRAVEEELGGAAEELRAYFASSSPDRALKAAGRLETAQRRLESASKSAGDSIGPSGLLALERLRSAFDSLRWAVKENSYWRLPHDRSAGRAASHLDDALGKLRRALAASSAAKREPLLLESRRSVRALARVLREGQERLWKGDAPFIQGLERGEVLRLLLEAAAALDEAVEGFLLESEGLR